jgi:hypothetical protein
LAAQLPLLYAVGSEALRPSIPRSLLVSLEIFQTLGFGDPATLALAVGSVTLRPPVT